VKFLKRMRDGGPESPVIGYFLVEIKSLFSVVLLHFGGTREAFHSHAFNAVTLWLRGAVVEHVAGGVWCERCRRWNAGQLKYTPRGLMHKVIPIGDAWAISFRGPWAKTWQEYRPASKEAITLGHGRKVVAVHKSDAI
jgi:hypothetical protein